MYPTHATPYSLAPTPASGEVTRFPLKRSERTNQATGGRNRRDRCILALRLVLAGALIVAAATLNLLLAEPATNATDFADATVLVTGYQPWGSLTHNPAAGVATRLNGTRVGSCVIESVSLPVSREGAEWAARRLASSNGRIAAVIHLGFESRAKGLKLEVAASNVAALSNATEPSAGPGSVGDAEGDRHGRCDASPADEIEPSAPCLLASTAPLDLISLPPAVEAWSRDGTVYEAWSRDAGTFFCNEQYFRTLLAIRSLRLAPPPPRSRHKLPPPEGSLLPTLFVHLPPEDLHEEAEVAKVVQAIAERMVLGR